jgi:hypothetical protein
VIRRILMSGALLFLHGISHAAENSPVKLEDVVGCWERITFSDAAQREMNLVEPWPAKYQWYCFSADGTLQSMSSSTPKEVSDDTLRSTLAAMPKDISFRIPEEGIIITDQPSADQRLAWGASLSTEDILFDGVVVSKGTLIMSLYSDKENKNVYYRYLKRVE